VLIIEVKLFHQFTIKLDLYFQY